MRSMWPSERAAEEKKPESVERIRNVHGPVVIRVEGLAALRARMATEEKMAQGVDRVGDGDPAVSIGVAAEEGDSRGLESDRRGHR